MSSKRREQKPSDYHRYIRISLLSAGIEGEPTPPARRILVDSTTTFDKIIEELCKDASNRWIVLQAHYCPVPWWTHCEPTDLIGATCQTLYAVDNKPGLNYVLGVIRTSDSDYPLAIYAPSYTMPVKQAVITADPRLSDDITSITPYGSHEDISNTPLQSILTKENEKRSPSFFVTTVGEPPKWFQPDVDVRSIIPSLQIISVNCKELSRRSFDLKWCPLRTIHVTGALLHAIISLSSEFKTLTLPLDSGRLVLDDDEPEESLAMGRLRVARLLADSLQDILDELSEVMKTINSSNRPPEDAQRKLDDIYLELCREYPGAVTIRHAYAHFCKLKIIDERIDEERILASDLRGGVIILLEVGSIAAGASDLLKPLGVICGFIKKVLDTAKSIEQVNEDWKEFMRRLKFHLATIECHNTSLEEDQGIDGNAPPLHPMIVKSLEEYASELNTVLRLLCNRKPNEISLVMKVIDVDHNKEVIAQNTRDMDDAFQRYTVALQQFVATAVDQTQQELAQFHQEFQEDVDRTRLNHLKASNAFGNQHGLCLADTRKKTLAAIRQWAGEERAEKWMFCLLDVAGSGKSTVAKHMAEEWEKQSRLIARYFFSRDTNETMSTNEFCSTVARGFAALDEDYKAHMDKFDARPDAKFLSFEERFEGLVAGPLRALNRPAMLTIDALDECDDSHGSRAQLLRTLRNQLSSTPSLRILVTGRPELDIKSWAEATGVGFTNFLQLEGENKDVEKYILFRLQHLPNVGAPVYQVISSAEGRFIWARIACDLLIRTTDIDGLLKTLGGDVSLDYLYRVALKESIPQDTASQRAMLMVLQMILAAKEPLSIAELEQLSPKQGVVEQTVSRLGSLLLYQDRQDPIRLLHATIREFLTTRSTAHQYYIQPELGHHSLASGCLNILTHHATRKGPDIDELDAISQRKGVLFHKKLVNCVFRAFEYSSRSWTHHCAMSYRKLALNEKILDFANSKLKAWVTVVGQRDQGHGLFIRSCVGGVLSLSRQNMVRLPPYPAPDLHLSSVSTNNGSPGGSEFRTSSSL